MNAEHLATVAVFTADLLNQGKCHSKNFGIQPPSSLAQCLTESGACNRGIFSAPSIYAMLYNLNVEAFHNRYDGRYDDEVPQTPPSLKIKEYSIHKPAITLETGKYKIQGWEASIAGLVDSWLYQTHEHGTKNSPLRGAMQSLKNSIYTFIVQNQPSYVWG